MAWKPLGAVTAALLLHGCIGASDSSGGAPVRWDSAGVTVVENHGETLMLDWVKDVGLQLGGNEQGEDSFHRVTRAAIATDDLGSLYVVDPDARRLVVFDEGGDFSWEMGREGDGPGEFRLPIAVAVVGPAREAWIYDIGSGRLTAVRDHGEVVTSRRIDNETVSGLGVLGGGLAYSLVERVAEGGEERLFVEDDGDGRLLHTRRMPASRVVDLETCGMRIPGLAPIFSRASMNWSSQGDRVAVVDSDAFEVRIFSQMGLESIVRRRIEPPSGTRERALESVSRSFYVTRYGCDPAEIVDGAGIHPLIPVVGALTLSPGGWLWVERSSEADERGLIDVFDPTGEYAGTLDAEFGLPAAFFPDGRLAWVVVDELDVRRVQIATVSSSARALSF